MNDITLWAEKLTNDVYSTWKSKYCFWKSGFKVFYSPIKSNPHLLIIGYQPGGDETHFAAEDKYPFERLDFSLPSENLYWSKDFTLAKRLQSLFRGKETELRESVAFQLIFFRSRSSRLWHSNKMRDEMEAFCYDKVEQILTMIKPNILLVLGFETYRQLQNIIGKLESELVRGKRSRILVQCARWNGIRVIAILHPSGNRISADDWNKIRDSIQSNL
jgi:hypothetical protein